MVSAFSEVLILFSFCQCKFETKKRIRREAEDEKTMPSDLLSRNAAIGEIPVWICRNKSFCFLLSEEHHKELGIKYDTSQDVKQQSVFCLFIVLSL
jgi:hypothetical protein